MCGSPTGFPARDAGERAQLTATGVHIDRGGRTVLSGVDMTVTPRSRWGVVGENGRGKSTLLHILAGALAPDAGTVHRIGTVGVAEQEMPSADGRTVGDLVDVELADARAALSALDLGAQALADERPGAAEAYAAALNAAEVLDAWDADRRVDLALENLGAAPTGRGACPRCRSGSATASGWRACWVPRTTSCCSTSPRTTSTPPGWTS